MIYLLLFVIEFFLLWRLSRRLNAKLIKSLPTGIYALFFLPGTFIHELSHLLMAKALFVRVGKFTLIPKKMESEVVLGSVAIEKKDVFRRVLIGTAPIIFGLALMFLIIYFSVSNDVYKDWKVALLISYFVFVIGNTMFSSKKDLEGSLVVLVVIVAIAIGFYILGGRIYIESDFEIIKILNAYLVAPIAIDVVLLSALSLSRR